MRFRIDKVEEAKEKLDEWFNGTQTILHEWTDDYTFRLVILYRGSLYFIRIFNLFCDTWELSQDGTTRLWYDNDKEIIDGQEFVGLSDEIAK